MIYIELAFVVRRTILVCFGVCVVRYANIHITVEKYCFSIRKCRVVDRITTIGLDCALWAALAIIRVFAELLNLNKDIHEQTENHHKIAHIQYILKIMHI